MWVLAVLIALYAFLTGLALGWIIRDERAICEAYLARKAYLVRNACLACTKPDTDPYRPGGRP